MVIKTKVFQPVSVCLSVAVLNARQRFGQILPRGATHTKYGREGGSGKCALQSFDKCCNVATGRIPMFLPVLPSSCYILLPAHFSIFPSSHLTEVFSLMSVVITLPRDKILQWLEVSKLKWRHTLSSPPSVRFICVAMVQRDIFLYQLSHICVKLKDQKRSLCVKKRPQRDVALEKQRQREMWH
jgi:hypothetical protein